MPAGPDQGNAASTARRAVNRATHCGDLKRKFAEVSCLYEVAYSEAQQLVFRRENHHPLADVELVAEEKAYLAENHKRRLSDIVTKHCLAAVKATIAHKWAWPFKQPVDTQTYKDYLNVVKQPMDLGTIKTRCETGFYKDPESFFKDAVLVFENARKYNPPGSDVYVMAGGVQEKFHERWAAVVVPKLRDEQETAQKEESALKRQRIDAVAIHEAETMEAQCARLLTFLDELHTCISEGRSMAASLCGLMPAAQQDQLCATLQQLGPQHMESVVGMVLTQQPSLAAAANEKREVEVNVNVCDALLLRQLQYLVGACASHAHGPAEQNAVTSAGDGAGGRATQEARHQGSQAVCWPGVLQGAGLRMRQRGSSRGSAAEVCVVRAAPSRQGSITGAAARPPLARLIHTGSAPDSPIGIHASMDPLSLDPMMLDLHSPGSYAGGGLTPPAPHGLSAHVPASFMHSPGTPGHPHGEDIGSPGHAPDEPAQGAGEEPEQTQPAVAAANGNCDMEDGQAAPAAAVDPAPMDVHAEAVDDEAVKQKAADQLPGNTVAVAQDASGET